MLVNRDQAASRTITINLSNFTVANGNYTTLQLSSLPSTETFVSHTQNALKQSTVAVNSNSLTITVPALSTTAILLVKAAATPVTYVTITNKATGLLMDGLYKFNDGANAGQWHSSGSTAQQWVIETAGSYVKIKNRASGLYLDGQGLTTDGASVAQKNASTSNNQQWTQEASGTDIKFKNRATGQYIDGLGSTRDSSTLGQWKKSNSNNQVWTVSTVNSRMQTVPLTENQLELYPNPFTTHFNLQGFRSGEVLRIRIFDVAGKQVETFQGAPALNQLSMGAGLKAGIYVVQIDGTTTSRTFKVVKIK
jgi:hypothetical protein